MASEDRPDLSTRTIPGSSVSAISSSAGTFEFVLSLATIALVQTLAHAVVFPGHYDPLWPVHSDFYIASELAHGPTSLLSLFHEPRPISFLYLRLTGALGTRLAIACTVAVVVMNCALTAVTFRRLVGLRYGAAYGAAVAAYAFLIFTHPLEYVWSSYDAFSQVSYFFLVSALYLTLRGAPLPWIICSCLMGTFAKETYGLALPAFTLAWLFAATAEERRLPLRYGSATGAALIAAAIYNLLIKSSYFGFPSVNQDTYRVDLSPLSVTREWLAYASEMGAAMWVYLLAIAIAVCVLARNIPARKRWLGLSFATAGALAWAPNSLLPNHHFAGYDWNGAYLLCTPILMLAPLWDERKRVAMVALLCGAFAAPVAERSAYKQGLWSLAQQDRQRNLMKAIRRHIATLSPGVETIVVTGLDFPFSPFEHPASLFEYAPRLPNFVVVNYDGLSRISVRSQAPVTWTSPSNALAIKRDAVWAFGEDGRWIDMAKIEDLAKAQERLGIDANMLALYPAAAVALQGVNETAPDGRVASGVAYLNCGVALLHYLRTDLALRCLEASQTLMPANPYPHFYAGSALETGGDLLRAKAEFERAIALDDHANPNAYFSEAFARVQAAISATGGSPN